MWSETVNLLTVKQVDIFQHYASFGWKAFPLIFRRAIYAHNVKPCSRSSTKLYTRLPTQGIEYLASVGVLVLGVKRQMPDHLHHHDFALPTNR